MLPPSLPDFHNPKNSTRLPRTKTCSTMSLITSHKKRKNNDTSAGKETTTNDKKNKKSKKDEPKKQKKLSPLIEGQPYQRGHRIFGWHTNKFTNQRTLRPCQVILRRAIGPLLAPDDETVQGGMASPASSPTTDEGDAAGNGGNSGGNSGTTSGTTTPDSSTSSDTNSNTAQGLSSSSSSSTTTTTTTTTTTNDTNPAPATTTVAYDYYVHFLELNRRNDCWLKFSSLQIRDEQGNFAPKQRKMGANSALHVSGRANVEFIEEAGHDKNEGMDEQSLREHEEITKVKNVEMIELGKHRMETWYFSPYPPEFFPNNQQNDPIDILYICEFTLNFFKHKKELRRHYSKNPLRHPPGNEIYRDKAQKVSMFEVDGAIQPTYCQNLCWLGKLFLDHKTLYYDVDPFMFYILTEFDERGYHIVGFYSKEKLSDMGYNLACILTLPAYQRKGYGKFLIEFSYALSKIEGKVGSPEKPLSDLGQLAYYPYWDEILLCLLAERDDLSIMDMCKETAFKPEDVIGTLQRLNVLRYYGGNHVICFTEEANQLYQKKIQRKSTSKKPRVVPHQIHWTPTNYGMKDRWALTSLRSANGGAAGSSGSSSSSSSSSSSTDKSNDPTYVQLE